MSEHNHRQQNEDEEETPIRKEYKTLSENTPVRLGMIFVMIGLMGGGFAFWIWWAATVSTKLDNIIMQQSVASNQQTKLAADVADLQAWRKLIDTTGSPQAAEIRRELDQLRKEFELHKALTVPRGADGAKGSP